MMLAGVAYADSKTDLLSGHNKLLSGNLPEALYFLKNAAASDSFILRDYAQYEVGLVYFKNGNYSLAAAEFEKVKEGSPIYKLALIKSAENYGLADEHKNAAGGYRAFISSFPDDERAAEASFNLAKALEKNNEIEAAYQVLNELDLYHPLSPYAKKSRLMIKSLAREYALPVYKPKDNDLFKKGMASFKSGDYEEAEAIFLRLARQYPKSKHIGEAFMMMGRAEFSGGKDEEAISNITRSLAYTPNKDKARNLYYLGRAYGRRGKYPRAMSYMKGIIDNYPKSDYAGAAAYYLALYYEYSDSPKAAISTYLYLAGNYPNSPYVDEALFRAGILYYKAYDFDNAYKVFSMSKIKGVGEETPKCLLWWGKLAERLGKTEAAAGIYYYLADTYDHTYASYRAREKLVKLGYVQPKEKILINIDESRLLRDEPQFSDGVNAERYEMLVDLGLNDYAELEEHQILAAESAQIKMGKILHNAGEYKTPIRLSEGKVKDAVLNGKPEAVDQAFWEMTYPKGFWKDVVNFSQKYQIDPYLTLAVIREESRFDPHALSRSRAHGLMQIMPATGKLIAKDLKMQSYRRGQLYNADTNIKMGTYYLKGLIDGFKGNVFLALAGYNGGPGRVSRWVKNWYNGDYKNLDIDEFIEYIPLRETRYYVQKVMGSYYEYKRLYGGRN